MKISLISPNIVSQKGDVAGTGIPYIPISLVYLATYLRDKKKQKIQFIDSFSEKPFQVYEKGDFLFQGITPLDVVNKIEEKTELIILYAAQVYAHQSLLDILIEIKKNIKTNNMPVLIVENTQAVTAYSLQHAYKDFLKNGADYVLAGESEPRIMSFLELLKGKIKEKDVDGLIWKDKKTKKIIINPKIVYQDVDALPFPDWSLVNIKNYWKLGYAHAPLSNKKYLPILSSRGCPLICEFCVVPSTNEKKWRPRNAKSFVDELEINSKKYGVKEFHLEDLNPTVNRYRIVDICKEIMKRKLKLSLKFAAGTKAETFDLETIDWMAKAGFDYISISPESGSPRVLKLMRKYFNHAQALEQVKKMHKLGIVSQACIVIGFPGETDKDLELTRRYVKALTKVGLDEVALFIMTPVPGSATFDKIAPAYTDISKLTFSPKWRKEYKHLLKWRFKILKTFLFTKMTRHPIKTTRHGTDFLRRRFKTKYEMTIYRIIKTHLTFKKIKQ